MTTTLKTLLLSAIANPKSSLAGLAILAVTFAFLEGRVTLQDFLSAFAVLTAGGLLVTKDSSK
jgi:hypothetical protein